MIKKTNHYTWLYDSLNSLKAFKYFRLLPNTVYQGVFLESKTQKKKIYISILRTSKRCYKVAYIYVNNYLPLVVQSFYTFKTCSLLCDWFGDEVLPQFKNYRSNKPKNILKQKGV